MVAPIDPAAWKAAAPKRPVPGRRGPGPRNETPPATHPVARACECLLCGGPMFGVHCKVICPNCGYREDCSDLFPT